MQDRAAWAVGCSIECRHLLLRTAPPGHLAPLGVRQPARSASIARKRPADAAPGGTSAHSAALSRRPCDCVRHRLSSPSWLECVSRSMTAPMSIRSLGTWRWTIAGSGQIWPAALSRCLIAQLRNGRTGVPWHVRSRRYLLSWRSRLGFWGLLARDRSVRRGCARINLAHHRAYCDRSPRFGSRGNSHGRRLRRHARYRLHRPPSHLHGSSCFLSRRAWNHRPRNEHVFSWKRGPLCEIRDRAASNSEF